jgi:hypothetical protein
VVLQVNILDPSSVLAQQSLMRSGLTVGVLFGTGGFRGAACTASATGRSCAIIVPANQPLQCWIWSADYSLKDATGTSVPIAGEAFEFQATACVDQVFTFTVAGKLAAQERKAQ